MSSTGNKRKILFRGLECACHLAIFVLALWLIIMQIMLDLQYFSQNLTEEDLKKFNEVLSRELRVELEDDAILDAGFFVNLENPNREEQLVIELFEQPKRAGILYAVLLILMALSCLFGIAPHAGPPSRLQLFRLLCFVIYVFCAIVFLIRGDDMLSVTIMTRLCSVPPICKSIQAIRDRKRKSTILSRVIWLIILLCNFVFIPMLAYLILAVAACSSLGRILKITFSRIRVDILVKIIRKTYAVEILLGLGMTIVISAIVLWFFDPGIKSFGDGLWYCFALVTTIGFGDITATTLIGRILSVFLGVYGIIVVALITSIIVNFYGETKDGS